MDLFAFDAEISLHLRMTALEKYLRNLVKMATALWPHIVSFHVRS